MVRTSNHIKIEEEKGKEEEGEEKEKESVEELHVMHACAYQVGGWNKK